MGKERCSTQEDGELGRGGWPNALRWRVGVVVNSYTSVISLFLRFIFTWHVSMCSSASSSQCHMMLVCDSSYQQNWNPVALECRIEWLRTSTHRFSFLLGFTLPHWQVFLLCAVKLAQNMSCCNFFFFFFCPMRTARRLRSRRLWQL